MKLASLDSSGTVHLGDPPGPPWAAAVSLSPGHSLSSVNLESVPDLTRRVICKSRCGSVDELGMPRWSASAWEAFDSECAILVDRLRERGLIMCFGARADEMLCDAHACRAFLERHKGKPFEVIADPAALLTPAMIPTSSDHLVRMIEKHASTPGTSALILTDAKLVENRVETVPLGEGQLDVSLLVQLAVDVWPSDRPVVLLDQDFAGNARSLFKDAGATIAD